MLDKNHNQNTRTTQSTELRLFQVHTPTRLSFVFHHKQPRGKLTAPTGKTTESENSFKLLTPNDVTSHVEMINVDLCTLNREKDKQDGNYCHRGGGSDSDVSAAAVKIKEYSLCLIWRSCSAALNIQIVCPLSTLEWPLLTHLSHQRSTFFTSYFPVLSGGGCFCEGKGSCSLLLKHDCTNTDVGRKHRADRKSSAAFYIKVVKSISWL